MSNKVREYLDYYKKKLERSLNDELIICQIIEKLSKTEFPVTDLLNTGIYKLIRSFCKSDNENTNTAFPLYTKWKNQILAFEQQNDAVKSGLPVQNNIPVVRVTEPAENHVNDSSRGNSSQATEIRNGFTDFAPKTTFNYASNVTNDRSHRNPSPLEDVSLKTKTSTPVQPPVNKFQPFSNLNSSFSVHNVKLESSTEVKNVTDMADNFDSHSNVSTAFSSPRSTSSQNPLDIGSGNTASPNKIGKIPDPYTIEMKEGMFRTVRSDEGLTPEIIRVRRLYGSQDYFSDSASENNKLEDKQKTPKKSEKVIKVSNEKNSEKISNSKPSDKSKSHTSDKSNRHKSNSDKPVVKSEKRSCSPLNKSAIEKCEKKIKLEKSSEVSKFEKNFSPPIVSSKSNRGSPSIKSRSKSSPSFKSSTKGSPTVKSSSKGSPSVKSSSKGSPSVKSSSKGSPSVKFSSKESLSVKSRTKSSPSIFINHAIPPSFDFNKGNIGSKDCDKKSNKVLTNDAAENYMSSKRDRTSVYSGKKSVQEVPSLKSSCVRVLRKNIDCVKYAKKMPYELLKPVLQYCTPAQLRRIEEYNPHLLQDTDELWQVFCQRKYRDLKPPSFGTWRDLYWRAREEQDKKLKNVTASISASMQKAAPERQVKLTLVESPERPRGKKVKISVPEPKDVKISSKESFTHHSNSYKESSAHKVPQKETLVPSHQKILKESIAPPPKKAKKAPVAPLMSKVKKTIGFLAMHKK